MTAIQPANRIDGIKDIMVQLAREMRELKGELGLAAGATRVLNPEVVEGGRH